MRGLTRTHQGPNAHRAAWAGGATPPWPELVVTMAEPDPPAVTGPEPPFVTWPVPLCPLTFTTQATH